MERPERYHRVTAPTSAHRRGAARFLRFIIPVRRPSRVGSGRYQQHCAHVTASPGLRAVAAALGPASLRIGYPPRPRCVGHRGGTWELRLGRAGLGHNADSARWLRHRSPPPCGRRVGAMTSSPLAWWLAWAAPGKAIPKHPRPGFPMTCPRRRGAPPCLMSFKDRRPLRQRGGGWTDNTPLLKTFFRNFL